MTSSELFRAVVEAMGLSMIIGPGVVRRALLDAGSDPSLATAAHYKASLARIQARLTSYLPPDEVAMRMARLRLIIEGELLQHPVPRSSR
jgi:hypothetical protein